ncbi:hypothetical protein I8G32_03937 [Rhodopseudomonas palustris]|nr:hypothetical protein I8G32_03937 [Rhodopseudomonas palustris]
MNATTIVYVEMEVECAQVVLHHQSHLALCYALLPVVSLDESGPNGL